jgi:hypothetical protein
MQNDDTIEMTILVPRAAVAVRAPASKWMRAVDSPLGERLVRKLAREGVFPSARPTKHLLIDREAHDRWIESHTRAPNAPPPANDDEADLASAFGVRRRGA